MFICNIVLTSHPSEYLLTVTSLFAFGEWEGSPKYPTVHSLRDFSVAVFGFQKTWKLTYLPLSFITIGSNEFYAVWKKLLQMLASKNLESKSETLEL